MLVDGVIEETERPGGGNMGHTGLSGSNKTNPWLELDMGSPQAVSEIRVYNRLGEFSARLGSFEIAISNEPYNASHTPCAVQTAKEDEPSITVPCVRVGRYISLTLPGTGRILNLREVQVFASASSTCDYTSSAFEVEYQGDARPAGLDDPHAFTLKVAGRDLWLHTETGVTIDSGNRYTYNALTYWNSAAKSGAKNLMKAVSAGSLDNGRFYLFSAQHPDYCLASNAPENCLAKWMPGGGYTGEAYEEGTDKCKNGSYKKEVDEVHPNFPGCAGIAPCCKPLPGTSACQLFDAVCTSYPPPPSPPPAPPPPSLPPPPSPPFAPMSILLCDGAMVLRGFEYEGTEWCLGPKVGEPVPVHKSELTMRRARVGHQCDYPMGGFAVHAADESHLFYLQHPDAVEHRLYVHTKANTAGSKTTLVYHSAINYDQPKNLMRAVSAGGQSGEFFLYSGQTDSSCLRQDWECPESHPYLAKWSYTDSYWCYESRGPSGASCNMASSGAPPPPDGVWGPNQDPCELKMVWSSSQTEGCQKFTASCKPYPTPPPPTPPPKPPPSPKPPPPPPPPKPPPPPPPRPQPGQQRFCQLTQLLTIVSSYNTSWPTACQARCQPPVHDLWYGTDAYCPNCPNLHCDTTTGVCRHTGNCPRWISSRWYTAWSGGEGEARLTIDFFINHGKVDRIDGVRIYVGNALRFSACSQRISAADCGSLQEGVAQINTLPFRFRWSPCLGIADWPPACMNEGGQYTCSSFPTSFGPEFGDTTVVLTDSYEHNDCPASVLGFRVLIETTYPDPTAGLCVYGTSSVRAAPPKEAVPYVAPLGGRYSQQEACDYCSVLGSSAQRRQCTYEVYHEFLPGKVSFGSNYTAERLVSMFLSQEALFVQAFGLLFEPRSEDDCKFPTIYDAATHLVQVDP